MAGGGSTNDTGGAPPQAGVLEGINPITYDPANPILLFIIQASIVIIFCQLLHYPLKLLNQPRVIAEVLGGILLGPTVMMRIPGFKEGSSLPPESVWCAVTADRPQPSFPLTRCPSSTMWPAWVCSSFSS
jgi:hypothetical protein